MIESGRGGWIILGAAIIAAIIFSVAAFAALNVGFSSRQRSAQVTEPRVRAQYAAEAGLVWALQQLWEFPSECFGPGPKDTFSLDTDGPGPLPPTVVDIMTTTCPSANITLQATVTY